jgi:hypothetical protein
LAVHRAVATERPGEIDELRQIRVANGLPPITNGYRPTPVLLLLDRAAEVLSACDVHSEKICFDTNPA